MQYVFYRIAKLGDFDKENRENMTNMTDELAKMQGMKRGRLPDVMHPAQF
jgi:hypothetical protein